MMWLRHTGAVPRRGRSHAEALPHRGGHAEALQRRLRRLLQRRHLLPVRGHAPHHASK